MKFKDEVLDMIDAEINSLNMELRYTHQGARFYEDTRLSMYEAQKIRETIAAMDDSEGADDKNV